MDRGGRSGRQGDSSDERGRKMDTMWCCKEPTERGHREIKEGTVPHADQVQDVIMCSASKA